LFLQASIMVSRDGRLRLIFSERSAALVLPGRSGEFGCGNRKPAEARADLRLERCSAFVVPTDARIFLF